MQAYSHQQGISQGQVNHGQAPVIPNKPRPNAAAAPAVSYTPVDTTIPASLYDKIPNLNSYKKLKDAEHQINLLISRKALDYQAIQQKSVHPSNLKKETGTLRVFIYNSCENQPWQKQLLQEQGNSLSDPTASEAGWALRIEGRFISDQGNADAEKLKFSSFLSGLSIDLIPNSDYPNIHEGQSNVAEWRDDSADPNPNLNRQSVFDGVDIKRPGVFNIHTKIALMIKDSTSSLKLSNEMAQFVGKEESTQQELIYLVWQYVLYKDLFKKRDSFVKVPAVSNTNIINEAIVNYEKDDDTLAIIECDDLLKSLLKVESFKFSDLYKLLQIHFRPREPIIIDYEINTKKSTTLGEVVLDIPIELPLSLSNVQKELLEVNKLAFENLTKYDAAIQNLSNKISLGIVALQNANSREKFYREFSEDPVKFIENWLESQSQTLKALKSDEGYDEELVRRASYFEENEDLLKDKIDLLLGSTRL